MAENIDVDKKENMVSVSVDPKIFPLDTIFSAAYVFIDDAYVIITGDPNQEVVVKFKGKGKCGLVEMGRKFNNELLNYAFYAVQTARTMPIRTALMQRAFFMHSAKPVNQVKELSYLDDPYGIKKPYKVKKSGRSQKRRK